MKARWPSIKLRYRIVRRPRYMSRRAMLRARTLDLRDQKNETGLLRLRSSATMDQPAMAEVLE